MEEKTKDYVQVVGLIIGLGILLFGIMSSPISEAVRYFTVTIVFLVLIIAYIQMVIIKRIEEVEKKVK